MWFGIVFAILVEITPLHCRSTAVGVFLFVMNNVGGNLPILVEPVSKAIGYRESLFIFYAGFYLLSEYSWCAIVCIRIPPSIPRARDGLLDANPLPPRLGALLLHHVPDGRPQEGAPRHGPRQPRRHPGDGLWRSGRAQRPALSQPGPPTRARPCSRPWLGHPAPGHAAISLCLREHSHCARTNPHRCASLPQMKARSVVSDFADGVAVFGVEEGTAAKVPA